jgi:hypothetical protein
MWVDYQFRQARKHPSERIAIQLGPIFRLFLEWIIDFKHYLDQNDKAIAGLKR